MFFTHLLTFKIIHLCKQISIMKYTQVTFFCQPKEEYITDVLSSELAEIGFESFINNDEGLNAFIQQNLFSQEKIDNIISNFELDSEITYKFIDVEDKNWNEEWEKNYFQPIIIDNRLIIHSSFHEVQPDNYDYRILIDPKMAFGTGHHQTTGLILQEILDMDVTDIKVLDMGCGTAVLGILAKMRDAESVVAIDIDEWAYNNALENIQLNQVENMTAKLGGAEAIGNDKFDLILANINRNILLQDMDKYKEALEEDGVLIMSGFYAEDVDVIRDKAEELGFFYLGFKQQDNWACVICSA